MKILQPTGKKDLTNKVFGRITIAGFSHKHEYRNYWFGRCSCTGALRVYKEHTLRAGKVRSCGCLQIEKAKEKILPNRQAVYNSIQAVYQKNAARSGRKWELSPTEFRALLNGCCHYCARVGVNRRKSWRGSRAVRSGEFRYNGVDRIDNSLGYTTSNVVSCCGPCNLLKGRMSYLDFIDLVELVARNLRDLK